MKQLFILLALIAPYIASAQSTFYGTKVGGYSSTPRHKTTAEGHDSLYMYNLGPSDTELYTYSFTGDNGYVTGINSNGFYGFAERYKYNDADSSIVVLGVAAVFSGKVNPASARIVDIKVWNAGSKVAAGSRPHLYYSGLPTTAVNSISIPYTSLGISDTALMLKEFYFPSGGSIGNTFFVGYTTNYSWDSLAGDTIAVATTKNGNRTSPLYTMDGADTIVNVQNATLIPVDVWVDNGFDLGLSANLWLFPIVNSTVFSHEGITRNDLTFYGNYPNPAVAGTAVKFALAQPTGVVLQVVNAAGHLVKSIDQPDLRSGDHIIQLPTSDMPAGNYLYVIRTHEGDGVVGKFSVSR